MTMWHLLASELVRFRRLAAGFALAHLVVLGYLAAGDLFAPSLLRIAVGLLVYAIAGLALGLYQLGTHARPNRWTYLVHRPLPPGRIHLALAGAGALLLSAVVALPQLLVLARVELLTAQPVDGRQWLLVPFSLGVALAFYLGGAFVALAPTRGAILVLVLTIFFLSRQAAGAWVFLPLGAVLLWLFALSRAAFKPDLAAPLRRPLAVAAAALPLQYALFWIVVSGVAMGYQTSIAFREAGWRSYARFAWNEYFPPGHFDHVTYLDGAGALAHGLAGASSPRAGELAGQIRLADVLELRPAAGGFPRRHQPMFLDRGGVLADEASPTRWTFLHGPMLFHGSDRRTGAPAGWLGPEGAAPASARPPAGLVRFGSVPLAAGRFVLAPERLWEYEPRGERLQPRFALPPGERFASPPQASAGMLAVLSERALYLFAARDLEREAGELRPLARAPLPGEVANLARVDVAELIDGHLVSFLFGARSARDLAPARQVTVELGLDGGHQVVADRALSPESFASWYRHRGFAISPAVQVLHDVAWGAVAPERAERVTLRDLLAHPPPPAARWAALVLALASAAAVATLARRRSVTRRERAAWTVAAALLGVPAALAFVLLTAPAEERAASSRRRAADGAELVREAA